MKLISVITLTIILLFGGMIYGQGNKKDSTIHFVTPKIVEQHDTVQPPVRVVYDAEVVPPPQIPIPDSQKVFDYVEQMPEFPGGQSAMMQFLSKNIQYPQQAKEAAIQGKVFAEFVVDNNGELHDIKILRGIGYGCDQEVIRVLKLMPKWKSGRMNGKAVSVRFRLPVNFKLADDEIKPKKNLNTK